MGKLSTIITYSSIAVYKSINAMSCAGYPIVSNCI